MGKGTDRGLVAVVARSDAGFFLELRRWVMTGKSDPELLEALACRGTIALASDINTRQARVASDCLSVIKNLEAGTQWVYALVVKEILESKNEFEHLSFCHEGMISNK